MMSMLSMRILFFYTIVPRCVCVSHWQLIYGLVGCSARVLLVCPHRCFIYPTPTMTRCTYDNIKCQLNTLSRQWKLEHSDQTSNTSAVCSFHDVDSLVCTIALSEWSQTRYIMGTLECSKFIGHAVAFLKSYGKPFVSKLSIQKMCHVRLQNQLNCGKPTRFVPHSTRLSAQLTRSLDCVPRSTQYLLILPCLRQSFNNQVNPSVIELICSCQSQPLGT